MSNTATKRISHGKRGRKPKEGKAKVSAAIKEAISDWLRDPVGSRTRLIDFLEQLMVGCLEKGYMNTANDVLVTALKYGPGEPPKADTMNVTHHYVAEMPKELNAQEWMKKYGTQKAAPPTDELPN